MRYSLFAFVITFFVLSALSACNETGHKSPDQPSSKQDIQSNENTQRSDKPVLPEQTSKPDIVTETDKAEVDGVTITLFDNGGACQIDDGKEIKYLKPMAPCYFVRQAGSIQTHQNDKGTVIALVGTIVKPKCGQETQGLTIAQGNVEISERIGQGSIFCADKGLDSFHFSLF